MKEIKFDFEEKRFIPESLMELYISTIGLATVEGWQRLSNAVTGRMELLVNSKSQLNEAMSNLIKSTRAYIECEKRIQQIPKNAQKRLLDATFEAGVVYAIKELNKTQHEVLQKTYADVDVQFAALEAFSKRVVEGMKEFGAQQGAAYFHPLGADGHPMPVYSGPQNPPRKPSGDKNFVMSETECWCVYCNEKVDKGPEDLLKPCEMLVHSKCSKMLGSKVTIADDTRVYDYGNLKKRPHNKTET